MDELNDLFDGTYKVIRPGPWKRSFRPSGFPYCPVIDAMSGTEDMNYGKAFYLDIGTTVHELMQEYISRSPNGRRKVFANWKCKDCDGMHYFSPLPFLCAHCFAPSERLHYEELEFENAFGIDGGHVDLLTLTKHGWIVGDWKTASTSGLDYRSEADGKHHHQLQAYCLALQELFKEHLRGLPIIGYCLIFVPRDVSGDRKTEGSNWTQYVYMWDSKLAKETRKRLFVARASYDAASIGYETGNWLPAAWLRPCESLADFAKPMGMRDGFFGGALCPNLDVCSRAPEGVAAAITKQREQMEIASRKKQTMEDATRMTYLKYASLGKIPPQLEADIKLVQESDEHFDVERLDSLLALKESLIRHMAIAKASSKEKVADFFSGDAAKPVVAKRVKPLPRKGLKKNRG